MLTFTPKMPRPTTEEADSFFRGRETAKVPVSVEEGVEVFFFDAQDDEDVHPNIDGVQYFIEEKFNGKSTFTEDEFQTIAAPAAGGKKAYRA
jgi:hypothetical protein